MANYHVDIDIPQATVASLESGLFALYGFKAVRGPVAGGAPLVWFRTGTYATETRVSWNTRFEAYTSLQDIIPNGSVDAHNSYPIELNETLRVDGDKGTGSVGGGGTKSAISIDNTTEKRFTCGISQVQDGSARPLCAFPLYGGHLNVMAPIERVLLLFSSEPVNTGTVIEQSYGPGILVDLTGAPANRRRVGYDINLGWSWDGGVWAREVRPRESLVPLLIENSASAVRELLAA